MLASTGLYLVVRIASEAEARAVRLAARSRARVDALETLERIVRRFDGTRPVAEIMQAVVDDVATGFDIPLVSIYLPISPTRLSMVGVAGYHSPFHEIDVGVGIIGRAASTLTTQFVPEVLADPDYRAARDDVRSEVADAHRPRRPAAAAWSTSRAPCSIPSAPPRWPSPRCWRGRSPRPCTPAAWAMSGATGCMPSSACWRSAAAWSATSIASGPRTASWRPPRTCSPRPRCTSPAATARAPSASSPRPPAPDAATPAGGGTGRPLDATDVVAFEAVDRGEPVSRDATMALPIPIDGEVAAVLVARRPDGAAPFGELERRIADLLATQVAVALRNADRHATVRDAAVRDPLTGLLNRRYFDEAVETAFATARRADVPLSLIVLDLDRFSAVNNEHGHAVGDAVLRGVARAMADSVRVGDTVARFGGEEFVVIAPSADTAEAVVIAERIRSAVAGVSVPLEGIELRITVSAGVASLTEDELDGKALFRAADSALLAAKRAGRDRVVAV